MFIQHGIPAILFGLLFIVTMGVRDMPSFKTARGVLSFLGYFTGGFFFIEILIISVKLNPDAHWE